MTGAGGAFLAAHFVGAAAATVLLCAGAALMTAAEMFASAANWIVTYALADPEHRGKYLSVYSLGAGLGRAAGPSVTAGLASAGALPLWPVIAALVAAGALPTAAIARSAQDAGSGRAAGEL
jgi:MFS family permease